MRGTGLGGHEISFFPAFRPYFGAFGGMVYSSLPGGTPQMGRTGIKQATDGSDAANRGMELLRLLHVQLSKRSVGTLVLGQRTKFREIFFEKDQVYLCGDRYSGRLDLESLVALEIAGRRLSLAELDRLLAQSDLTRELFPQVLRAQNLISASEERDLLERHVREEISDLLLQNDESFHFQN
ncbi:MAG TPA: DUF4388 domain-containing protein, partial [Planctomycetota bacterium]|nr:DUF4388 domain-containing protein [Planctomycetota bacterium]